MSQIDLFSTGRWSLALFAVGLLLWAPASPAIGQVVIIDLPSNDPAPTPDRHRLAAATEASAPDSAPAESPPDEDPGYDSRPVDARCAGSCPCGHCGGKGTAAAAKSHKTLFYDNDFSYLLDPCYNDCYLGDCFKRLCACDSMVLDVGGQFRMRQHSEQNHRRLGLTGNDDNFLLYRARVYANAEIGDGLRVYGEMVDAVSDYESFAPRPIEENRTDVLNLFGDMRLHNGSSGDLWARLGRQEMLYGAQRTISPLDWANTRRTFEGAKAFWKGDCWNVDAFWTSPVITDVHNFDHADYDRQFMGVYATQHGNKGRIVDLYYLRLDNDDSDFDYHTFGGRIFKTNGPWMLEIEGAYQFGDLNALDHSAGAWTCGLGRKFNSLGWKPALWVYYDWASGADEIGNGYHHLFPLSHKYLGFMDLFGRRNIETPNVLLTCSPCEKLTLTAWYYAFWLENGNDVPYNVNMTAYNAANAPADDFLGQELDLTAKWQLTPRAGFLLGYSRFFSGDYYANTPGVGHRGDADFYYTQFTLNF